MTTYRVNVTRADNGWCMIYVPEIDRHTQARNLGEIEPWHATWSRS